VNHNAARKAVVTNAVFTNAVGTNAVGNSQPHRLKPVLLNPPRRDRATRTFDLPVASPKEVCHPSCWKPKWRRYEKGVMKQKTEVQQGTLALMVLKTLDVLGSLHGYGIARRIEQISGDLLAVNQGTLYPVLLKLEQEGAIASDWGASENNRRARFYRLTKEGRKQLQVETQDWEQTAAIIGRFFEAKAEDLS
jgi:PadR family transcriptional regulator PadR